ncbi:TSUP family transporter [Litorimonas sp. RW-G-Af-16]|uniref:TSUP family transporter n=1 Tax=Litorimonas sp. RW-G-Af-16 TaxID=3241168 RepID=UPI00390CAA60
MKLGLIIIIAALVTATISGLFGMAGGMIFMGIIAAFLGVAEAMVVHGAVQSVSNSFRTYLLRPDIRWDILGWHALGAVPSVGVLLLLSITLNKSQLYLALGLLPLILWLPRNWLAGDAEKPAHAVLCGAMVMGLNLTAGVAGPALDFFYVKTGLTRLEIVATKAMTMFVSHLAKIFYFGAPLAMSAGLAGLPPLWVFIAAIPAVLLGTFIGTRLLHRLSDIHFRSYTKYLVTLIGAVYVFRGIALMG